MRMEALCASVKINPKIDKKLTLHSTMITSTHIRKPRFPIGEGLGHVRAVGHDGRFAGAKRRTTTIATSVHRRKGLLGRK